MGPPDQLHSLPHEPKKREVLSESLQNWQRLESFEFNCNQSRKNPTLI